MNLYKISYITLLWSCLAACKGFVEIPLPQNEITSESVFSNRETANAAVVGVYSQIMSSNLYLANGGLSVYTGLMGDELVNTSPNSVADAFAQNNLPSNQTTVSNNFWNSSYSTLYHINSVIEKAKASSALDKETVLQIEAEMRMLRGFYYFYLGNLFGDVPLALTSDYRINSHLKRTPKEEVYKQVVDDLMYASLYMGDQANMARPSALAAKALLCRVSVYLRDWEKAEQLADEVINAGRYTLCERLTDVFLDNSPEVGWAMAPLEGLSRNTVEGNVFIPASASVVPTYQLQESLLESLDEIDKRKTEWIANNMVNGHRYYFPFKYKVRTGTTYREWNVVIRFAELFLNRAEAATNLGKVDLALTDLNTIRLRAGLPRLEHAGQKELISLIEEERKREFFAEWGHRWFDLKRTNRIDEVLSEIKPNWKSYQALLPIPYQEMIRNPNLSQNEGYD